MRYISTRGTATPLRFDDVLLAGLARDGGLYVPESWPRFAPSDIRAMAGLPYHEIAYRVMAPFVEGAIDQAVFQRIVAETYAGFDHAAVAPLKQLSPNEWVTAILSGEDFSEIKYLFMATERGTVKKTEIAEFANIRSNGLIAIKLNDTDRLKWVKGTSGDDDIMMITKKGQSIRFSEKNVRSMGRVAAGVRGLKFKGGDLAVGMDVVPHKVADGKLDVLVVMSKGYGKRTDVNEYRLQGRGGSGIRTARVTAKNGDIVRSQVVNTADDSDLMVVSTKGQIIRLPLNTVSKLGRDTQGVKVMTFKEAGDSVSSVTLV